MTTPPRRWRFQIHLSTAIVLMFVAGGFIWANVHGSRTKFTYWRAFEGNSGLVTEMKHGWPLPAVISFQTVDRDRPMFRPVLLSGWRPVVIDAGVALSISFAVWFLCEWLIRRRAARKGA